MARRTHALFASNDDPEFFNDLDIADAEIKRSLDAEFLIDFLNEDNCDEMCGEISEITSCNHLARRIV